MRIAAAHLSNSLEENQKMFSQIGSGVVLLSEGSLDTESYYGDWTIDDIAAITRDSALTIIGEKKQRVRIIRGGQIILAQYATDDWIARSPDYEQEADKVYDVSCDNRYKLSAICRVCAGGNDPFIRSEKYRILFILSGGVDWEDEIEDLLLIHGNHIEPNGYIVQCNQHFGNKFIFSVAERKMVHQKFKTTSDDRGCVTCEIDV